MTHALLILNNEEDKEEEEEKKGYFVYNIIIFFKCQFEINHDYTYISILFLAWQINE